MGRPRWSIAPGEWSGMKSNTVPSKASSSLGSNPNAGPLAPAGAVVVFLSDTENPNSSLGASSGQLGSHSHSKHRSSAFEARAPPVSLPVGPFLIRPRYRGGVGVCPRVRAAAGQVLVQVAP